ncbi:unnamed protein product [Rotaria sordida]|uniref:CTLH domain-containing protein n=1 Tax=Rotaria sordida TaxID=392033 RepID=A0A815E2G5_9BILA|nr:unnamed protein product [Rotaria sordida]
MESSPRTASIIVNDLEQRLQNLHTTRIHDEQTLNNLESLLNECSNHLNYLISSSNSTSIAIILPTLLHTIISLSKICTEKSDIIILGSYLTRDKLTTLITMTKTLYNQIKGFIKSSQLSIILMKSTQQRHFCEQLRIVSDSIANIDILTTLICHKLIVKLLTGNDEQQSQQQQIEDINDGLIIAVYGSILQRMATISSRNLPDKLDNKGESPTIKMYGIYFQMLCKLVQYNNTISQIESYQDFIHTIYQIHICLETTCQQKNFQEEFFNNTILLQEILQNFIFYSLKNSSKIFFNELFYELSSNKYKYASLIILFRVIEAFDLNLTKQFNDDNISIYLIHHLISYLFNLIDQCRIQLILPALLPRLFNKTQVKYDDCLYDKTYSILMKLFNYNSMQTILSSMFKLIQISNENSSIILTSIQLSSELIIQSWYLYNQLNPYQYLFGLFLAELFHLNIHINLINYLLTIPNIEKIKFYTYDLFLSSNIFHSIYDLYLFIKTNKLKEPIINSINLSYIYPTNIEHLYIFIRLFNKDLNINQIQYTIDTCIYSIQQFLSLTYITELTSLNFIIILRLLSYLIINNTNEIFKCLLGQLTQIFILLDEQTANDIRLELLNVFTIHSNILDDNDLSRLLDYILINSIETNSNSISFHIQCLNLIDSLRQRQSRSININDLIIQLIVKYGNEYQCSHLLKVQLMRIFMAYITNGNDDSLPIRVKSQCALLRADIDEFEKNKKTIGTTNNHCTNENILKILDSTQPSMITTATRNDLITNDYNTQLKFYQTIVNELEFHQCSISQEISNTMQQD